VRKNLPVTAVEYLYPENCTLVSVTDLKGRIVYCNRAFIEVSGYDEHELIGKAHNLIRHPDMPPEAFRDMWATIQSGVSWTALVKNRRKDGSHYWVRANATPMRHGERVCGYLSVRTKPERAEIASAEALYARMNKEAQAGRLVHRLHKGSVERSDLLGRIRSVARPTATLQLFGVHLAAAGMAAVADAASSSTMAAFCCVITSS